MEITFLLKVLVGLKGAGNETEWRKNVGETQMMDVCALEVVIERRGEGDTEGKERH